MNLVRSYVRFPRHRAAASLKLRLGVENRRARRRFPRHRAAASLKRAAGHIVAERRHEFSAASGRGLIEASASGRTPARSRRSFPRHRAAASLKRQRTLARRRPMPGFPRHRAAASLKRVRAERQHRGVAGFPRHRAAASLKPCWPTRRRCAAPAFSAASGRGLIEAGERGADEARAESFPRHRAAASLKLSMALGLTRRRIGFPRHRAAASLKPRIERMEHAEAEVFRGIGPRPH